MLTPDEQAPSPESLPGIPLPIPVPSGAARAFGYRGAARFVGFFWMPDGDEVVYDDGRSSGTGSTYVFLAYRRHQSVAPKLEPYNIGYSDADADYYLLLDRDASRASVAPIAEARTFLRDQHPPPPELTPYEMEEAQRQMEAILTRRWRQVRIDPETVHRAMEQERQLIARMLAALDQWRPS